MTFNITVPNANQSPGLFPAQNNTNFQRLQQIIDNDHLFTNSFAANQGTHKQVTLINRSVPVGLPAGTNAILYSFLDGLGTSQLAFYNGITNVQITPGTINISSSASIINGADLLIFADPGYEYVATGWAVIQSALNYNYYTIIRHSTNLTTSLNGNGLGPTRPTIFFTGDDLYVKNNFGSTQTVLWNLLINRIG